MSLQAWPWLCASLSSPANLLASDAQRLQAVAAAADEYEQRYAVVVLVVRLQHLSRHESLSQRVHKGLRLLNGPQRFLRDSQGDAFHCNIAQQVRV